MESPNVLSWKGPTWITCVQLLDSPKIHTVCLRTLLSLFLNPVRRGAVTPPWGACSRLHLQLGELKTSCRMYHPNHQIGPFGNSAPAALATVEHQEPQTLQSIWYFTNIWVQKFSELMLGLSSCSWEAAVSPGEATFKYPISEG